MTDISDEDKTLFRQTIGKVDPIRSDQKPPTPKNPSAHRYNIKLREPWADDSADEASQTMHLDALDMGKPPTVTAEDTLRFARTGLQHRLLKKLRQGQLNVDTTLDLHGLTLAQVNQILPDFLHQCKSRQYRVVHLIHGKGHCLIKNHLNHWLRTQPQVLAFHSAINKDGGAGALYVLLKS